jgi:sn-glycerol 3-phosphate transport system permease protein
VLNGAARPRGLAQRAGGADDVNSLVMALVIAIGKIAISHHQRVCHRLLPLPAAQWFFFWMIFVTLMLPVEVRIIPTFKVVADLGMLDSYAGLTLPLIASATATFLFRQFFMTVPDELAEAARIDGAGPMRFFIDVLLPLSRPVDRGAVRDPVHLRLEPVPVAAADHQ